ncbi:MAG: radical SAM/SPASM domain-containing protein [Nostoc sp.]|uniref:radical SAM/SPASM domain-containing protein n=1 Tax=Nostoc sp. TaxID=1180 RepID=UPI002FF13E29
MSLKYVQIETTSVCNHRCFFCPVSMDKREKSELSVAKIEKIIEGLHDHPIEAIALSGFMEATYDQELVEKINVIRNAGYKVSIYSNGSGLKPELTDQLLNLGVSSFTFNLSTLDAAQYLQTRGSRDLPRVLSNLDYLLAQTPVQTQEVEVTLVVVGALDQQHAASFQMIQDRFADTAVSNILIIPMVEFAGKVNQGLLPIRPNHQKLQGCLWNRDQEWLHFDADGEAILCCHDYFSKYKMGNINDASVTEIYQADPIQQWRRWISGKEEAPADFICRSCAYAITDNHVEKLRESFCDRCELPDILGVDNSCKKCGDVGQLIDAIEKHPELLCQA